MMSTHKELKERLEYSERRRTRMQRLLARETQEDDPFLWSMVDIMTLLLVFFILLYASTIGRAPAPAATAAVAKGTLPDAKQELRRDVGQLLAANQNLRVRWDQSRPVFVLDEPITFEVGQAELLPEVTPVLIDLAHFIARHPQHRIGVAGHTDDVPIHTARFPSNWELSTARAVSVVKFLCAHGADPRRISAQGHAEYAPLRGNTSAQERQRNRRVEITLYAPVPDHQPAREL